MSNKVIDVHIPDINEILTLFYSEETNLVENLQFSWEGMCVLVIPIPLASVIGKSSSLSIRYKKKHTPKNNILQTLFQSHCYSGVAMTLK